MPHDARARCSTHDLALGPNGMCVLCRRTLAPPASAPRAFPFVALGIGSLVLLAAAIGASRLLREPALAPAPSVAPETIVARAPEPPPPAPRPPASRVPSSAGVLRARADAREDLASPEPTPEPSRGPSEAALAAARGRVSITMYSTSWCGVCAQARAYLDAHHVRYTEHDVESSDRYERQMHALNPRGSVPTFDIDGEVLVGFGPESFEQTVDEAALAHVRR